jgi:tRNA-Thr(GGU) m(6)t(6)A37 methyltransferase TsaA
MNSSITFNPIGYFKSKQVEPYQAARQPDKLSEPGEIILNSGYNFEQALQNLDECSHIWIIYHFHHNQNWKPLVQTPRVSEKIGVFATRAPYRPNPIGMTAVQLLKIEGLKIKVGPNDILDGTPIIDIKPYHPESDRIDNSTIHWLQAASHQQFEIRISPFAEEQFDYLQLNGQKELKPFVLRQLEYYPINSEKKRVKKINDLYQLSYRTWRIDFLMTEKIISILSLHSGYSDFDLAHSDDKYQDKELHKKFNKMFN